MRYAITVDVAVPRETLVTLVDDPVVLSEWLEGLRSVEALQGTPGLEGSATRLVLDVGGHDVEVVLEVVENELPDSMTTLASANGSCAETRHEFEALGPSATRWTQHVDYAFTGPGLATFSALMPGALAARTRRQMRSMKTFAEQSAEVSAARLVPPLS